MIVPVFLTSGQFLVLPHSKFVATRVPLNMCKAYIAINWQEWFIRSLASVGTCVKIQCV